MSPEPLMVHVLCAHMILRDLILQLLAAMPNHLSMSGNPDFVRMDSKVTPITDGKILFVLKMFISCISFRHYSHRKPH